MTTSVIRKKVIRYLADVDDKKIKAIYSLLENEIEEKSTFNLSTDEIAILDKDREAHLNGKSASYSWEEAKNIIRKK